ncbi:MAG: NUDIX hydrolase [Spirochaetota bacterium]|nr:NUDIX hydrolase [Spirochaetota bacterium]
MRPKQVFPSYNWEGNSGIDKLKYCPHCGMECILNKRGGRERPVCQSCGYVHFRNPYPGVVVLIKQDERVLLGKRAPGKFRDGKWCLPGGFIEFDEDFLTAANREVKEETGFEVEIQSIISVVTNYLTAELHTLVIVLLAKVISGTLTTSEELDTLKWFPLSGPLPEMAFDADKHIIERYYLTRINGAPVDPEQHII